VDPASPSDDSRLDALLARATQVAVEGPIVGVDEPRRGRPIFIWLALLGIAAIGAGFIVASRDGDTARENSASTRVTSSLDDSVNAASTVGPADTTGVFKPSSGTSAPSSTAATATTVDETTSTTVSAVTTAATPLDATTNRGAASEVLTGPPSMQLPGGQPWPNGLYQDNIMYLRGAVPSEEIGGDLQRRAEEILGAENVRNELVIDPTVPKVETVIVRLGNSVLFKSGDFDIPPESEPGFVLWAAFLQSNPTVTLTVIGHADSRGTPESNQALALERARVAAERITRNGIDPARVTALSRGADDPVALNDTQEGRALNRRVEFAVTGLLNADA
jgi:outer membrane protein OmpA-like peptidoglycan-associated protein